MDAVEDVKQRLNIEDVVGEYVELRRAGRNFKGLSPFSNEKSPSFMVSPEKQIWHDFSSGKGGNMFSFVMEMEGLDFRGALELLARKAGIDLDQYRSSQSSARGKEKDRLYEVLDAAATFYQKCLNTNLEALEYVRKKRRFSKETQLEWRLGYSPATGTALIEHLRSRKFTDKEIQAAGLSAQRYRGIGDMFRGRIMIPLCDREGRVVGFTARILLDDPKAPKYINTPQTLLYDKSNHVFGFHLAKDAIRRNKFAVIAEGNLDVISSHQAGVRQVVATAGTALTEGQLKLLGRFTEDVRLSFDADNAGLNATERSIPIANKVGVRLSIITIPEGKDPDELIKANPLKWKEIIEKSQYAVDWLIDQYSKRKDLNSADGKKEFTEVILTFIKKLDNPVEEEHYKKHVAKLVGIDESTLAMRLNKMAAPKKAELKQPSVKFLPIDKDVYEYRKLQNHLLSLILVHPSLRKHADSLKPEMFFDDSAEEVFLFLKEHPDFKGSAEEWEKLRVDSDYVKILLFNYEKLYQNVEIHEKEYEITQIMNKLISQYVKMQKQQIVHELQSADDETQLKLLQKVKELDNLLRTHKGGA
ncbi:MAG TPA: DNA primase [Candidatus Saccharimonadales bacterium]|nr:DNA primase [Candidatus Saccharimonadales bacterium]